MSKKAMAMVAIGAIALAAPVYAGAKPGNGHANGHAAKHVFKGTYAGGGVVSVTHGNSKVRRGGFVGTDVAFDLSAAKITVADKNADGVKDVNDVLVGDKVLVGARLAKDGTAVQPFPAQRLVDKTKPPGDEGDGTGEEPPEEPPVE